MLELSHTPQATQKLDLFTSLAIDELEVLEAQRLRYKVFAEEMGAHSGRAQEGVDCDIYDKYCEHLLIRERIENAVVGTFRILSPGQAQKIGGYYSQNDFDLTRLLPHSERMAEIGRICVHWDYRNASTSTQLWNGLTQYMQQHGHDYLIGSACISMSDGGHTAASIYRKLHRIYSAPVEYTVFPRHPLPLETLNQFLDTPIPPLLKGFLRLGAYICGRPAWNQELNTADMLILLPKSRMDSCYVKHFAKYDNCLKA